MRNESIENSVLAERVNNISQKIENIDDQLVKINDTINTLAVIGVKQNTILEQQEKILEQNTESLKEHMRRTDLLEKDSIQLKSIVTFIKWSIGIFVSSVGALVLKFFLGV